jgi:hypothetical protein
VHLSEHPADLFPHRPEVGDLLISFHPIHQHPGLPHDFSSVIARVDRRDRNGRGRQGAIEVRVVEVALVVELQREEPVAEPEAKEFAGTARPCAASVRLESQRKGPLETTNEGPDGMVHSLFSHAA